MFQSPSLRGSGRFGGNASPPPHVGVFQSPSLRGSGRFQARTEAEDKEAERVSIPFIAGQWSLLRSATLGVAGAPFQSPSLRGSGRFTLIAALRRALPSRFNPLHCGAVVASLRGLARSSARPACFNPLHCGAVVASGRVDHLLAGTTRVSIPFIAGQWSLPHLRLRT